MEAKTNDDLETGAKADAAQVVPAPSPFDLDKDGNIERNEVIISLAIVVVALAVSGGLLYALKSGLMTSEEIAIGLATFYTTVTGGKTLLKK